MSNQSENMGEFKDDERDSLGRFKKGSGGRPLGSKNKLREKVRGFVETNIENLQTYFDSLEPKDKIKILSDLLPFVISKLQSVSVSDDEGNPVEPTADFTKWSDEDLRTLLNLQEKNGVNKTGE